jgi:hypothetical protein
VGGAARTDEAAIAVCPWPVDCVRTTSLDVAVLDRYDAIILGNLEDATTEQLAALSRLGRHVLFEHDYRMCRFRGDHRHSFVHRVTDRCWCRQRRFGALFESARGAIFLTQGQLDRYRANPFLHLPPNEVLGCSIMGDGFFATVERYRKNPPRKHGTAVVFSHEPHKGFHEAVARCRTLGVEPIILKDPDQSKLLEAIARVERLVFTPVWFEPASRLVVEARYLGCSVVTNDRVGVTGEAWWSQPDEVGFEVLRSAAGRFWEIVARLMQAPAHEAA